MANGLRTIPSPNPSWRSRIDGSERLQLTTSQSFSSFARWSPDGRQIAYISSQPGQPDQLFLVAKDGGSPRVLYQAHSLVRPSWLRDGSAMVFAEAPTGPEQAEVQVLDLKTRQMTTLPDSRGLSCFRSDGQKLRLFDFSTKDGKSSRRRLVWDSPSCRRIAAIFTSTMA